MIYLSTELELIFHERHNFFLCLKRKLETYITRDNKTKLMTQTISKASKQYFLLRKSMYKQMQRRVLFAQTRHTFPFWPYHNILPVLHESMRATVWRGIRLELR